MSIYVYSKPIADLTKPVTTRHYPSLLFYTLIYYYIFTRKGDIISKRRRKAEENVENMGAKAWFLGRASVTGLVTGGDGLSESVTG